MFCPKCSQAQPSDEMRFCSRCGFPLETVSVLVTHEGILPEVVGKKDLSSIRSRMATESLILTVVSWSIALLLTIWFDAHSVFEYIAKIGALTFGILGFIGLVRFLYAFLFLKINPAQTKEAALPRETVRPSLPPAPISDWTRKQSTREMVTPASVTENTTRLLDDES